jgi:hypothetical protein
MRGKAEICKLDSTSLGDKNVRAFDVAMQHTLGMQIS